MRKIIFLFLILISFMFANTIKEREPNNTFYNANFINITDIGEGNLDFFRDNVDVWKITPKEDGLLTIYTTGSNINMNAEIYDKYFKLVGYDYSQNKNISISIYVRANQTYYIALFLNQRGSTSYSLSFKFTPFKTKNIADFHSIFNKNINGKLIVIGNHNVCWSNNHKTCLNPGRIDNNDIYQSYINVDDSQYINSSEADLNLNNGDKIIKAYLFWMGRIWTNNPIDNNQVKNANKVEFKTPTTEGYVEIDANETSFNWYYGTDGVFDYGAYADVTPYVKKSGKYYLANLQVSEGYNTSGGWSLVIITQNPNDKFKKIVVYQGFQAIFNQLNYPRSVSQELSGFYTPTSGKVDANFIFFANETDINLADSITLTDKNGNKHYLSNSLNPPNNVLNCTISKFGKNVVDREPNYVNTLGTDIDEFNVSNIFDNSQTKTDINITSNGDRIFLEMFGISIQLYVPKVCYYDLRLYKNNQLVTPATKLYVGDKIKVSLKIKNNENESAKNVYFIYPIDTNITKYINNSTYVKNVLSNNYINLKDNTSYKNLQVIFSNNVLSVGVLGDDKNEFLPFRINPEYVAGIEFNESIESEGKLSFKFYTDYNYTLGNSNYHYHGLLPNCNNMNNYYNTYTPQSGIFNVVHYQPNITFDPLDVNNSINDLYTQIVNKDNNFTLVHLGEDNQTLSSFVGVVKLDLIKNPTDETECKTNPSLKSIYVFMLDEDKYNFDFSYEKAIKNARFRVDYLYFPDNSCMKGFMYRVRNRFKNKFSDKELKGDFQNKEYHYEDLMSDEDFYKKCAPKCLNECYHGFSKCKGSDNCKKRLKKCLRCLFDKNEVKSVCSRDNFAIRPYKFEIVPITSPIKAGDEFNLTIKAVGYLGNPVEDYNETIVLKGLSSPDLNYIDLNTSKGCITGILSGKSFKFKNGIANLSLNYSEVGDLNLSIKENKDTEFAKVDEKDHNNSDLFIKQANTILKFIPYDFKVVSYFKNFNNGKFTYLSNDLNMSAIFDIELKVVNKQNQILQNYNSKCYAKNIQINASYTYNKNLNFPTYLFVKDDNNQTILKINSSKQTFEKELSKDYFKNFGLANIKIYLNFSKDYKTPVSSFEMNLTELNLSDKDINKTINNILSNVIFRYGRIAINDVVGYSNELNSTVKYEYWDDNKGWIVNKEHNSSIYGDINLTLSYYPNLKIQLGNIVNGEQNLTISTTHALPYSTKVHLAIPSWLWYHPLAKPYKNPKTSSGLNLDCLTHPCFSVSFQKNSKGWGGIESTSNAKYNEENRTVKSNSSIKINKDSLKKINW